MIIPVPPTQMLSNVMVYYGNEDPANIAIARDLVNRSPQITFHGLLLKMLRKTALDEISVPYIWWIHPSGPKQRRIQEDSHRLPFVRIDNRWHLAYPLQILGPLAGAQDANGYEDQPRNIYFITWDNKNTVTKHY
ncbi:MAG: hypothetical protein KUF72_00425 [Candidatus Thiodiazotropha sp. (ex Ctena orbiculata)]|nr:hypothetical protein [Candidatus Thiodiazotropha taylori]